jgi:hypothetical protein
MGNIRWRFFAGGRRFRQTPMRGRLRLRIRDVTVPEREMRGFNGSGMVEPVTTSPAQAVATLEETT